MYRAHAEELEANLRAWGESYFQDDLRTTYETLIRNLRAVAGEAERGAPTQSARSAVKKIA